MGERNNCNVFYGFWQLLLIQNLKIETMNKETKSDILFELLNEGKNIVTESNGIMRFS